MNMKLYLESQMPPRVSYDAYKLMKKNIKSLNDYRPKPKDYKMLCMTYSILMDKYYNKEDLKLFLNKINSKALNNLLVKDKPIAYYLLSSGVNYYSEFLQFNKKNIQYDFIDQQTKDSLLMTFYKAEVHCPDASAQMTDILLKNGVDVQHINVQGQNIVDLMTFPYLEEIEKTDYIIELYGVIQKHNKGDILLPNNWNDFVFGLYTCYPQETIDDFEIKLGVNFLSKIDDKAYQEIVFNMILYNKEDKKNTLKIEELIDKLPDKKILTQDIKNEKFNKWLGYKFKNNETVISNNGFLPVERLSGVNKPKNLIEASLYKPEIVEYMVNNYSSYISSDDLNQAFKYIDDNIEQVFIDTKEDLLRSKNICETLFLKNNADNINRKMRKNRIL